MFSRLIGVAAVITLLLAGSLGAAELRSEPKVAKLDNEKPKWGDTITVTYDPSANVAKLVRAGEIYTLAMWECPGIITRSSIKMSKEEGLFKAKVHVPEHACGVTFVFFSMEDEDPSARISTMLYRPDGEPARGAYALSAFTSFDPDKELALYPDDYAVYPEKWDVARGDRQALVRTDISSLRRSPKAESSEYLYALAIGYAILKDEPAAREEVKKLIEHYPESPFTSTAVWRYKMLVLADDIEGDGPDQVRKLFGDMIREHPETESGRMALRENGEDFFRGAPIEALEGAAHRWIKEEEDNPQPYFFLAAAYKDRALKLNDASALIAKATNLFLHNKLRLHSAFWGKQSYEWLPDAYRVATQISLKQQDYPAAFSSLRTLESFQSASPETAMLEAQIWEGLANTTHAEREYLKAWRRGARDAEKKLKPLYLAKNASLDGFRSYLVTESQNIVAAETAKNFPPTFRAKALDGTDIDLTALRGKIVVLNFWFIGCVACEVERPGLNQLVKSYKDEHKNADVVFVSITPDKADALRTFLAKKPFDYSVVPEGEKLAAKYAVNSFPTHIIIDPNGLIALRCEGGSPTIWQDLRLAIDRLLE